MEADGANDDEILEFIDQETEVDESKLIFRIYLTNSYMIRRRKKMLTDNKCHVIITIKKCKRIVYQNYELGG